MPNIIYSREYQTTVCDVPGLMHNKILDTATGLFRGQTFVSCSRDIDGYGKDAKLSVEIRFDDKCRNKHQTFSITAEVRRPRARDVEACGCLHDEIAAVFPEFTPLIKWHLTSTDGPMHYLANTTYFAGNQDLDAARRSAIWPEATDEQLCLPKGQLTELLVARLPALIAEFRHNMEAIGMLWEQHKENESCQS